MQEALEAEKIELDVFREKQKEIEMTKRGLERQQEMERAREDERREKAKRKAKRQQMQHTEEWRRCVVQLKLLQEERRVLLEKVARDGNDVINQLRAASRKHEDIMHPPRTLKKQILTQPPRTSSSVKDHSIPSNSSHESNESSRK